MIRCAYWELPDMFESGSKSETCNEEANFTCCNFGGPVCEQHKCRCSKPLTPDQRTAYEARLLHGR